MKPLALNAVVDPQEHAIREQVVKLREFYTGLLVYVLVNIGLWILNYVTLPGRWWVGWVTTLWGASMLIWGFTVFGAANGLWFGAQWQENKVRALMAKENLREVSADRRMIQAQLRLLQAQIEPHFLFNTLANVQSLIAREPQLASSMLERFIAYLRQSLSASRELNGSLGQEIDLVTHYLELLKIRMGKRLEYSIEIANELRAVKFAPMLLQPIVENAIKHGLEPKVEGGRVSINVRRTQASLHIVVSDNGLGFSHDLADGSSLNSPHAGVGLSNLRERLQLLYGPDSKILIQEANPGTQVLVVIPWLTNDKASENS
jgi:LytS/YehU family sensor histidine kinase